MKFRYWKLPTKGKLSVPIPLLEVNLPLKTHSVNYVCLIDSGADYCFFHAKEIGEDLLNLDIKTGKKIENIKGITGSTFTAYFHTVDFKIGGWEFKEKIAFSYDLGTPYGILGRQGFFDNFKVCIEHREQEVELKPLRV